jgi:hypothetical protein
MVLSEVSSIVAAFDAYFVGTLATERQVSFLPSFCLKDQPCWSSVDWNLAIELESQLLVEYKAVAVSFNSWQ